MRGNLGLANERGVQRRGKVWRLNRLVSPESRNPARRKDRAASGGSPAWRTGSFSRGIFVGFLKGGKCANFRSGLSLGQPADNGHGLLDAGLSDTQSLIPPAEIDQIDVVSGLGIIAFTI